MLIRSRKQILTQVRVRSYGRLVRHHHYLKRAAVHPPTCHGGSRSAHLSMAICKTLTHVNMDVLLEYAASYAGKITISQLK